ncbi:MAG: hypothetical protein AB7F19_02260 [Candidatus Babeliales bacterium]
MNIVKHIILFISLWCIAFPAHAMDSGDGDQNYFDRALNFAKEHSGALLAVGALAGAGVYAAKQMRTNRAVYGSIWGPTIKQLHVLNQYGSADHGGDASCGYQSLKNAIYICRMLSGKAGQPQLTDLSIVQQLFNKKDPKGGWRKLVLENTYRRAIKWHIDQKLYALLISYNDVQHVEVPLEAQHLDQKLQDRFKTKIRGFYQGVLATELSPQLVAALFSALEGQPLEASTKITITRALFIDAVKKSQRIMKGDIEGLENFDFVAYAKSDEALALYVPENTINAEHIFEISKAEALQQYNAAHPDNKFDAQGDWVNENEIGLLLKHEQQVGGLLADLPVHFDGITIIDNVPLLNQGEGEYKEIIEIAERLAKVDDFIHAFVVGLMSGKPGSVSGSRHWITLVVHKHHGIIEYSVADSGANASRIKDGIIWTLIKHLTSIKIK